MARRGRSSRHVREGGGGVAHGHGRREGRAARARAGDERGERRARRTGDRRDPGTDGAGSGPRRSGGSSSSARAATPRSSSRRHGSVPGLRSRGPPPRPTSRARARCWRYPRRRQRLSSRPSSRRSTSTSLPPRRRPRAEWPAALGRHGHRAVGGRCRGDSAARVGPRAGAGGDALAGGRGRTSRDRGGDARRSGGGAGHRSSRRPGDGSGGSRGQPRRGRCDQGLA